MKSTEFHPVHYDAHGRLRLPLLFWLVLLLQARTWVLFVIAGASREQGTALLNLFYPDHDNFWLGLIPGIPAVLAFLLSGRRATFPRTWRVLYFLLLLAQVVLLCWQPWLWLNGESVSGIWVLFVIAGASREQGTALLNLFYPDHDNFWLGLIPGIPAVLAFLLSGRRATFPRTWRVLYFLLLLAQVVLLCWQPWLWLNGESVSGIGLALVVADIVALIWLLTNRRLRACFNEVKE
ncbi:DUF2919 domain-containing protein [Escherichia coli]|nr:DUF2919 domain-containing protein [Escherichia coli]